MNNLLPIETVHPRRSGTPASEGHLPLSEGVPSGLEGAPSGLEGVPSGLEGVPGGMSPSWRGWPKAGGGAQRPYPAPRLSAPPTPLLKERGDIHPRRSGTPASGGHQGRGRTSPVNN
jgi:hypothetical protein